MPKNGFYYFMKDFKEREEKKGNKFKNFKEIKENDLFNQEWKALSDKEKEKYNKKAHEKRTAVGDLKLQEKQRIEHQNYEMKMKEYINNSIEQAICHGLHSTSFYFIHVNWYYTKVDINSTVDYIPAEFSVIEFSFHEGIKRRFHEIIRATVETGYAREAMEHSDATHKISISRSEKITNYKDLYNKFLDFITYEDKSIKKLPPLYTSLKMENVVPCFFERMTKAAGASDNTFDLYSLEYLFGTWMLKLDDEFPMFGDRSILAEAELNKDAFIWAPNIECSYHRHIEGSGPYCSQTIVTQWIYTMCNYCCPLLNIKMIDGKHCPDSDD